MVAGASMAGATQVGTSRPWRRPVASIRQANLKSATSTASGWLLSHADMWRKASTALRVRLSPFVLATASRIFAALFPCVQFVALPSDATASAWNSAQHASVHLYGEEYDVSKFATRHPGGSLVLQQLLGQDCTDVFAVHHPSWRVQQAKDVANGKPPTGALRLLHGGKSASFKAANNRSAMQRDFDLIVQQLEAEDKFSPTPSYYCIKAFVLASVLAAAIILILVANSFWAQEELFVVSFSSMHAGPVNNYTMERITPSPAGAAL